MKMCNKFFLYLKPVHWASDLLNFNIILWFTVKFKKKISLSDRLIFEKCFPSSNKDKKFRQKYFSYQISNT